MELSSIGVSKDRGDMDERRSAGDENELFGAFFDVAKRFELELGVALKRLDLTGPLADLLHLLEPDAPPPAMKVLAARLHCDPSSVTFLADRLLVKGLIERAEDPHDRRSKVVRLTAEGARVRGELLTAMREQSVLAALDAGEQAALLALLRKALAG
jgi:DNA-binding MarR family transcriptional regulator